jgi:hypothetical protein
MSKYVRVGIQLPIDSEWNKMSEQQPPAPQEPTSIQVSTSNMEAKRYIYENIKIGDDCLVAAVSVSHPMTIKDYEMGNRSADIRGEVSQDCTERMAKDHAVAVFARAMALQRQYASREEAAKTNAGSLGNFESPGHTLG